MLRPFPVDYALVFLGLILTVGCDRGKTGEKRPAADIEAMKAVGFYLPDAPGPFSIYTNAQQGFAIFDHSGLLVRREFESNQWTVDFCRGGLGVFSYSERTNGMLSRASCTFYDQARKGRVEYLDKDGDGEWDIRVDLVTGRVLVPKPDSWIERTHK
jgi:hypothetical protein